MKLPICSAISVALSTMLAFNAFAGPKTLNPVKRHPASFEQAQDATILGTEFSFTFDTEQLGLWQNGKFDAQITAEYGIDPQLAARWMQSDDDYQLAGVDTDGDTRISKLVYHHRFSDLNTSISAGLQDFRRFFRYTKPTAGFLTPSLQLGPDINTPGNIAFAKSAVGIQLDWHFDDYYLRAASYDSSTTGSQKRLSFSSTKGLFSAVESGINTFANITVTAGAWSHLAAKNRRASLPQPEQSGFYLIAEKPLFNKATVFIKVGQSNTGLVSASGYRSAGAVIRELFSGDDALGLALSSATIDDVYSRQVKNLRETGWEVNYQTPSLLTSEIKTSLFYQHNPDLAFNRPGQKIMGVRFYRALF